MSQMMRYTSPKLYFSRI
uniref:Uncharacterized protein n=1 Tax=Arundo donax TaxID=35708 RepID=A0A0A9ET65_ARUDO